jgi:hypothetical protein
MELSPSKPKDIEQPMKSMLKTSTSSSYSTSNLDTSQNSSTFMTFPQDGVMKLRVSSNHSLVYAVENIEGNKSIMVVSTLSVVGLTSTSRPFTYVYIP